ncbi:MAG: PQQ-binding-like beta-propeller repeat protein [Pirellula sp.]
MSSRDTNDASDWFVCLDSATGIEVWKHSYVAKGNLDYGNSPRAAPLIVEPNVYLLGAFGDLSCLDLENGSVRWRKHLIKDLGGTIPAWGYCSSPLYFRDRLIVQPGGSQSHMIALDLKSGKTIWKNSGRAAAYASPMLFAHRNQHQVIAYDVESLGGWSLDDGTRLWEMKPKNSSDFNVPTPIVTPHGIVLVSENNGTRLHLLNGDGMLQMQPAARFEDLCGDTHTPICLSDMLVGTHQGLYVLDLKNRLELAHHVEMKELDGNCSIIGFENRALILNQDANLSLFEIEGGKAKLLGKAQLDVAKGEILSHPAVHGGVLYVRTSNAVEAWLLGEK